MQRNRNILWSFVCYILLGIALAQSSLYAQAGFNDDRVMLQGFYWESNRHGHQDRFGQKKWYEIVRDQAPTIRDGRFDLIWLPPPSFAGEMSAGYNPKEYFNLSNSYGDRDQHRSMLEALLQNGVEPIADIVINHRDGTNSWAGFTNPAWDTWAITKNDEAFKKKESEVFGTPEEKRGAEEEHPKEYTVHGGTTYQYDAYRDIDHTNQQVRRDIIKYLLQLKSMGYRGWRYDMVHGYHAKWIAVYNRASRPTFSVGEFEWGDHPGQRGWAWHTATNPGDLRTSSSVFDFSSFSTLKHNKTNYPAWYGFGNGIGLIGDTTDGQLWKNKAVTFLENHDTGFRTNPDGSPEKDHNFDSFTNNWEVEQGYAYILAHPGVPTVYWKHYFDWGSDLKNKIKALINARKVAGVHAGSVIHLQHNALARGVYAALVLGSAGELYVRIGGNDKDWEPYHSNYRDYREYAQGVGWKVWVKLPGNPEVQQAPFKASLPIPEYREPQTIDVPDGWLQ
jgi:alpha-amylase